MSVKLNHTIVHARDKRKSADFYCDILGLPAPTAFGPFLDVQTANEVTLAFLETDEKFEPQHYSFLISEEEFDVIFARIVERNIRYWADPGREQESQTYTHNGGRGLYFQDPDKHLLEIQTRPYV